MDEPESPADGDEAAHQRAASGFRRLALLVLASGGVLGLFAAGTVLALYLSATAAVPEYEAIVEVDPVQAEADRKAFESQLAALASDTQALPEWSTRVTAGQINAWFATRLRRDFPGFQKAGLLTPRVILREGEVVLAARSVLSRIHGVISLAAVPRVTPNEELALEIAWAKIGSLPLPLDALFAQLQETPLARLGPLRLTQAGDTAAVIIDLDRLDLGRNQTMGLVGVDVREGELLLRGTTKLPDPPAEE